MAYPIGSGNLWLYEVPKHFPLSKRTLSFAKGKMLDAGAMADTLRDPNGENKYSDGPKKLEGRIVWEDTTFVET